MRTEFFDCLCHSNNHLVRFTLDSGDDPALFLSYQLIPHKHIFKRIWVAVKYIFGNPIKYGHWQETLLDYKDSSRLYDLLDMYHFALNGKKCLPDLKDITELKECNVQKLYNELLYQVGRKFPNETRHETALRYLKNAETVVNEPAKCSIMHSH
jgi:hypothetical protein